MNSYIFYLLFYLALYPYYSSSFSHSLHRSGFASLQERHKKCLGSVAKKTISLRMLPRMSIGSGLEATACVAGVVAIHEAGHFLAAKWQGMKIQSYNIGYGPKLFAFNDTSQTEFALRAFPFGGYVAFPANVEVDDEGEIIKELDDPDLLQNRPPLQRAVVICAGVVANILLTVLLASGTALTTGISHPIYAPGVEVKQSPGPESPAFLAGIREGDLLLKINSRIIPETDSAIDDFIREVKSNTNKEIPIELLRNGKALTASVTPRLSAGSSKATIGLNIARSVKSVEQEKATNPIEALVYGLDETKRLVDFTWNAFARTATNGFSGNELGGPISVVKTGAEMADTTPLALVGFAATLSVNLAVLNALPFPALDGGQLVFVIIELLANRPIPRTIKDAVTALAFSFFLALGVTTMVGDVQKINEPIIFRPTSMPFQNKQFESVAGDVESVEAVDVEGALSILDP